MGKAEVRVKGVLVRGWVMVVAVERGWVRGWEVSVRETGRAASKRHNQPHKNNRLLVMHDWH